MITGQAEYVVDAEGCGAQNVTLQGNSVPVADHHLQHRIKPHALQMNAGSQTAESGYRSLIVGDVYRIHVILDQFSLFLDMGRITGSWGTAFTGDCQVTAFEYLL